MLHRPIITIPQPCHENWAQMTPATQGRHCSACDKVVVNFSRMTDAEIVLWLQRQQSDRICGRFATQQLNRPLQVQTVPVSRWPTWLAATAAVAGLHAVAPPSAHAQYTIPTEQHVITMGIVAVPRPVKPPLLINLPPIIVRGIVLDSISQQPIPGVTILLKNTTIGTSTNSDGTFEIRLSAPLAVDQNLIFSAIGYTIQYRSLGSAQIQELSISLSSNTFVLGELAVPAYIVRKPWPWHPRAMWYRVRNAFRR